MAAYPKGAVDMEIKGKRVIIIGERDGIPGPAIEAAIQTKKPLQIRKYSD